MRELVQQQLALAGVRIKIADIRVAVFFNIQPKHILNRFVETDDQTAFIGNDQADRRSAGKKPECFGKQCRVHIRRYCEIRLLCSCIFILHKASIAPFFLRSFTLHADREWLA
jgi:hypothetical protein